MSRRNPKDPKQGSIKIGVVAEKGPQPDPMLREGRAGGFRMALVVIGIVVIVTLVFYGIARQENTTTIGTTEQPPAGTTQPPANVPPAGR